MTWHQPVVMNSAVFHGDVMQFGNILQYVPLAFFLLFKYVI